MINVTKTYLPPFEEYNRILKRAWDKAWITNNGELVQDVDLSQQTEKVKRHDGTAAPPLKYRARKCHIELQLLSRNNEVIQIRGARIRELK